MVHNKVTINPRIYHATIAYLEEKIKAYEETYDLIKNKDDSSKRECRSRLDSCNLVLEAFKENYIPGAGTNTPTGHLISD